MRRTAFFVTLLACIAVSAVAYSQNQPQPPQPGHQAAQQVWIGFVTDMHCGTHCQVTSNMTPDLKCVRLCVERGSKYGLWSDNKVYELDPQSLAAKFAAKSVRVTGTMTRTADGGKILAASIVPAETAPPLSKPASR